MNSLKPEDSFTKPTRLLLTWGSLALAAAESLCVAAVGLSGMRVALGMTSLLAAGAGGPAYGFHSDTIRIPLLTLGAVGALISLLLLWNEDRLRRNPSAAWRVRPLTTLQPVEMASTDHSDLDTLAGCSRAGHTSVVASLTPFT